MPKTSNAVEIIHNKLYKGNPKRIRTLKVERFKVKVMVALYKIPNWINKYFS